MEDLDWISDIVGDLDKYPLNVPVTTDNVRIGMRVVRGKNWRWQDQDKHNVGTVVYLDSFDTHKKWELYIDPDDYWVTVRWDYDKNVGRPQTNYRIGPEDFDLYVYTY